MNDDDADAAWAQHELEKRQQEEEDWQRHERLVKDLRESNINSERESSEFWARMRR